MPRGVPNPKKDDFGMRYTSMHVPLAYVGYRATAMGLTNMPRPNPKHMGTTYLKSESQTLWARNAARKQKTSAGDSPTPPDQRYVFIQNATHSHFVMNSEQLAQTWFPSRGHSPGFEIPTYWQSVRCHAYCCPQRHCEEVQGIHSRARIH